MRKAFWGLMFFLLVALSLPTLALAQGVSNETAAHGSYSTRTVYAGIFAAGRLYKRYPQTFWQGSAHPAFLTNVSCSQARFALQTYGKWTGNLNADGSCGGDAEPHTWATGNFVNYRMSHKSQ